MRKVDLSSVAPNEMRRLADRMGMPVHLGVLTGASLVYVAKAALPGFIQFDTHPGKVSPFNLTALGKAIAAYLPEEDLEPLLQQLEQGRGPKAKPATAEVFLAELAGIRKQGFAFEDQEEQADIACVAVPFFDATNQVAGSVGVTGFAKDLTRSKRKVAREELVVLGRTISERLGSTDQPVAG
jgi:DNA-binding IclR family transcriptional regulator